MGVDCIMGKNFAGVGVVVYYVVGFCILGFKS